MVVISAHVQNISLDSFIAQVFLEQHRKW